MVKSIIKEICIMLLLCIAIALILGIVFYNYIPTNRVIPSKQAYVTQDDIKEEINEQITELEKTEISYEITDADLNIYKQTSSYRPGKRDPFSEASLPADNTNTTNNGGQTGEGTQTPEGNSTDPNSTNSFFDEPTGIK